MKYIDLTYTITENMPVYPGTEKPVLERLEIDGYRETLFHMFSHTGTHMDAPYHVFRDGRKLEDYSIGEFTGRAVVIDVPHGVKVIEPDMLKAAEGFEFIILRTGWGAKWGTDEYFDGFPVLSLSAAEYAAGLGLKGIGLDSISVDEVGNNTLPVHRVLLGSGMLIIENLAGLEQLPSEVNFTALPLKYADADGCSVRAFASF